MSMARLTLSQVPDYSFFVRRSLPALERDAGPERQAELLARLASCPPRREDMRARLAAVDDPAELATAMRRLRREVMLAIVARDLTGAADYQEVVDTVTALAEETVSRALSVHARALARRFGQPRSADGHPQDLLVIGMGKLGGGELNVSSDIDLVFVYDEGGETVPTEDCPRIRRSISNHEFFERLGRQLIPALSEVDATGFVFRVDTRLRPFGDSGPLVVSHDMLEEYLYSEGRDWERFAWLKARVVSEPVFMPPEDFARAVAALRSLVRPFVFRKYVDFSAISSLRRVHELIRAETSRREAGRDTVNVKLGSGGIREIEFIAQTFQVMRGGREPALRGRSTLPILAELSRLGVIPSDTADRLAQNYVFLRDLEHALQYVDDQQTQTLPSDPDGQARIAAMRGLTAPELRERLAAAREFTARTFDGVFSLEPTGESPAWPIGWYGDSDAAAALAAARLTELGYGAAPELAGRARRLINSRRSLASGSIGRERLAGFIAGMAETIAAAPTPAAAPPRDEILSRYLSLLEAISGRPTYIALLSQYPTAAARVGRLLAASSWAAGYLDRHPLLLDELVDGRERHIDDYAPVDWTGWSEETRFALRSLGDDREQQMNQLRDAHHGALFHLLLADLDGRLSVERLADQLSALADAALGLALEFAWLSLPERHRETPRFAIIGYGKLGGKELGYASDLDLVFLYDDDDPRADAIYSRLVRRLLTWLTAQTSSGVLFDVDTRLRPNGQNGLTVASLEMFRRYQRNAGGAGAWTWEHQALTRGRFCVGDPDIGRAFEAERAEILRLRRDPARVSADIIEMRRRMLDGHPNDSPLFDLKHDRGGMVDIEFIVQKLILCHSCDQPRLVNNFGNILLLEMASEIGLVEAAEAAAVTGAYRRYRELQRAARLNQPTGGGPVRVPPETVAADAAAVRALWRRIFGTDEPMS